MVGIANTKQKLDRTLVRIASLLGTTCRWFIGYGTLLGIVRGDSCIEGDDDVDILVDAQDYEKIKTMLIENHFKITYDHGIGTSKHILKTTGSDEFASVDFYCANINDSGDFHDVWEKVVWSDCFDARGELLQKKWKEVILYLPNNSETKLENRYGKKWKIPQNNKGPMPRAKII